MKDFKARAWDKDWNEYIDFSTLCCPSWSLGEILANYELEQYTGLKDKNGREIYEGDVVTRLAIRDDSWPDDGHSRATPKRQEWIETQVAIIRMTPEIRFGNEWITRIKRKDEIGERESCKEYDYEVVGNVHEPHGFNVKEGWWSEVSKEYI